MCAQRIRLLVRRGWAACSTSVAVALWSVLLVGGWWSLERYESAAGAPLARGYVDRWPADSSIARHDGRSTVLFFMHPKCPCTRASLYELERVFRLVREAAAVDVVCVATVPTDADDSWLDTDTLKRSSLLPNSRVVIDRNGVEAARFGATTSGTVMLFDAVGGRRYAGGVTIARGHEGHNAGSDAVEHILRGQSPPASELPTFGCGLCLPKLRPMQTTGLFANTASRIRVERATRPTATNPSAP